MDFARRVYEDTLALDFMNMDGCMEDGSIKNFCPNGFAGHIYSMTLLDRNVDYDAKMADYFSHLYGGDWRKVKQYLEKMTEAFDFGYMLGEKSIEPKKGPHYDPARFERLSHVKEYAAQMRSLVKDHLLMAVRPQSVAWRVLLRHAEFFEGIAECMGHDRLAVEKADKFFAGFATVHDFETEPYFDLYLASYSLRTVIDKMPEVEF